MSTGAAASRLQDNSLLGIGVGLVAVVAAGYVCSLAGFSQQTTTGVMGLAIAVPPAVELKIKSRHRDTNVDIMRLQRGELRRPIGLVVMLLAAAIVLLDSAPGAITWGLSFVLRRLEDNTAKVVGGPLVGGLVVSLGMWLFLVASYASHYFARRPYLWTATAVGCALAVRELVVLAMWPDREIQSALREMYGSLAGTLVADALAYLGPYLLICMVGVWVGTRYHDAFLAKRLARLEGKAAREAAKQDQSAPLSQTTATQASARDSSAPQEDIVPFAMSVATQPNGPPSSPHNLRTGEPLRQIGKLAQLRDTGALTEEEFQAKKAEILGRI
jgi:Short C-terminal domain